MLIIFMFASLQQSRMARAASLPHPPLYASGRQSNLAIERHNYRLAPRRKRQRISKASQESTLATPAKVRLGRTELSFIASSAFPRDLKHYHRAYRLK